MPKIYYATQVATRPPTFLLFVNEPSLFPADYRRYVDTTEQYADYLYKILPGLRFAPIVSTTATQSRNLQSVLDLAQNLFKKASRRVTTGELNRVVEAIKSASQEVTRADKKLADLIVTRADECRSSEIQRCARHRRDLAGRNQLAIGRRITVGVQPQLVR